MMENYSRKRVKKRKRKTRRPRLFVIAAISSAFILTLSSFPALGQPTQPGQGLKGGDQILAAACRDISGAGSDIAWIVGDGGLILKTIDGGATWIPQDSGTTSDLQGVSAVDLNIEIGRAHV